jgi:hypothetical protein
MKINGMNNAKNSTIQKKFYFHRFCLKSPWHRSKMIIKNPTAINIQSDTMQPPTLLFALQS